LPGCVSSANVAAPPVNVATSIEPLDCLIAPAEFKASVSPPASITPSSLIPPVPVVSATVCPVPVSVTGPSTVSA